MPKLKEIVNQPEGRRLEFKASLSGNTDLAKTIIAFANDAGGELYLGIQDSPREVVGIEEERLIEPSWKEPGIAFRVTFVNKNYKQPDESQPELQPELQQELQPELQQEFKEVLSTLGTKLGLSRDQVGTKSGPSRDQAGTKQALSRHQVGTKSKPSWDQVIQILDICKKPQSVQEIMKQIKWSNRTKFRNKFINPLLDTAFIQMTIPDKPNSSKQQYQITERGEAFLQFLSQNSKDL